MEVHTNAHVGGELPVSRLRDQFDAVVVGRQDTGGLKIFKKPLQPAPYAVWAGAGLGLPSRWFVVRVDYAVYPLELMGGSSSVDKRDQRFTILFGVPFR